jgi:HNH endonuclease
VRWKEIFGGLYLISERGDIRNNFPLWKPCRHDYRGRLLRPMTSKKGYLRVELSPNGKGVAKLVHDLVAETFIGPRPPGKEVNHKDTKKLNNWYRNLEYVTHQENIDHAVAHGLFSNVGRKRK